MITKIKLETTLQLINKHQACSDGIKRLERNNININKPINLLKVAEYSLSDFFWAWRCTTKKEKKVKRMILHDIIKNVQHLYENRFPESNSFKNVLKALATGRNILEARDANAAVNAAASAANAAAAASAAYAYAANADVNAAASAAYAYAAANAAASAAYAYAAANAAASAANAAAAADYAANVAAKERNFQSSIIKKYLK